MPGRGLTDVEKKAQAARCPCHGSNDYCPCQNAPDATTRKQWGAPHITVFTNRQKADVALREVAMRKKVYGRWVQTGRIAQDEARYQIAAMTEIASDYTRLADAAGEPIGSLL